MPSDKFRTMDDLPHLAGKTVLVRVDFNVPVNDAGEMTDDTRIRGALNTLRELTESQAKVVVVSHRGRPKKWGDASLEVAAERLQALMGSPVHFVDDILGEKAEQAIEALKPGEICMLQNLRYEPGEKAGDQQFSKRLASYADFYVNDAFGTAHREDASCAVVPKWLPGYAGRLLEQELSILSQVVDHPKRPYWAVLGGAKVSDKVGLIAELIKRVDGIVVGGGMANTFLAAQGKDMGASKVEDEARDQAREILELARGASVPVVLPDAVVAAKGFHQDAPHRIVAPGELAQNEMALDVAPSAVDRMLDSLNDAGTVLWNGPMGVFEWPAFREGTMRMAKGLAALNADVIVGGGDSAAAVAEAGIQDQLTHVSTGGGAALKFLEGQPLPAVVALSQSPKE